MTVRMLYFAWVREMIGTGEEVVATTGAVTVADLLDLLSSNPAHADAFADRTRLRAAIDQRFVLLDAPIAGAREIAIFPPVTGG